MKSFILVLLSLIAISHATDNSLKCATKKPEIPKGWIDQTDQCTKSMREQISKELTASLQYMAMGAHFARDTINRPGFADFFFKSASEEREHAMKLISYLLMRGHFTKDINSLIDVSKYLPEKTIWDNGVAALRDALELETKVTKSIREVIRYCEDDKTFNDYHLVDYLTGEFLEEQYKGQRELAGKLSTLSKMMDKHGALGEFLYDKKM